MTSPVLRSVLEKEAKKLQVTKGLKWTKALEEASKQFGFNNYKHYLNSTKSGPLKANFARKKFPVVSVRYTGGARERISEILKLLDKSDNEAYIAILEISKSDTDLFKRFDAAQVLFNHFNVPSEEVDAILQGLPADSLEIIKHLIKKEI